MFCTKCGKELKDDARFCTSCGCEIPRNVSAETVVQAKPRRKIRTSWIVIAVIAIILIIALAVDRNSPENVKARAELEAKSSTEETVTWEDVRKSKQELDKSIDDLKKQWNEIKKADKQIDNSVEEIKGSWRDLKSAVKQGVKDAVKESVKDAIKESRSDNASSGEEIKKAVRQLKEETKNLNDALNSAEVKEAQDELKSVLNDLKTN